MKRLISILGAMALSVALGCSPKPVVTPPASSGPAADAPHTHGAGPHGGALTDWGGGAYHVEFTVDHDKKEVTVYIVGSDEKSPAPIKTNKIHLTINEPLTDIDLTAMPLDGEATGTSSRFVGTHDTIGIVREFAGTISGEIEGTPYAGDFKEVPAGAEHKH